MEEIRAFVGHSFDQDDAAVVSCYLKYFDQLANLHPRFSWGHAEAAEPMVVAEKVMSLIANKNVFIGICTKKERVIQQGPLQKSFFHPRRFVVGEDQCYWKTSDWIIQEIGLAKGRNLEIILLIEAGVRVPGGLQSDLEYIPFDRNAPEKSFGKILEMITALSPRSSRPAAIATSTQAAPADEQNTLDPSEDTDWEIPKPEWTRRRYEVAFWLMSKEGNEASAETIHKAYLTTEDALQDDNKTVWEAYCEYTRLSSGKGESFAQLKELAAAYPNSSGVLRYLALGFEKYQDYAKSAPTYEAAAMEAQNEIERLRLLKNAAKAHARTGAAGATAKVIDQMKVQVQTSGVGEEELLQALKEVAEVRNENEALLGIMERMVYLDPSDTKTRFSLAIPSPKSVNLKGLREVRRVVVYHNDNSKPPGSPHGHFSTFAMPPTRCVQNNAASIPLYCCGAAGHDGTRHDVGPLPLDGSRRQLPDRSTLFLPGDPVGHAVLAVLSSACLPC